MRSIPPELDAALSRLTRALEALETGVARRLDAEKSRADIEAELAAFEDDRARLAAELDTALGRATRMEAATGEVSRRLDRALADLAALLAETPAESDADEAEA